MRFSLGTARQWHWISAAVCMLGMLFFAITGITLNHASDIPSNTNMITVEDTLPQDLMLLLTESEQLGGKQTLYPEARQWLKEQHQIHVPPELEGKWQDQEFYLAMPLPGADAWLAIDAVTGEFIYENSDRGWVAYFNDLHKGRDSGDVWRGFIDVFSVVCIIFTLSGLLLLIRQSKHRLSTWPVTALGLVIPMLLIVLFIH